MPLSNSQVRVINPILSNVVQGYKQPDLVGGLLFPRVPVEVSGGQILEFGKESFMQFSTARAPGGATKRIQFGYLGKPFALFNHGLEAPVPREYLRDAKVVPGIDLSTRAVNLVMKTMALTLEIEQAALATNASNYGATSKVALSGTSKWTDPASDPTAQILTYKNTVRSLCGTDPNVVVLCPLAFAALQSHQKIIDRIKYVGGKSVTVELLAQLWNVEKVVVGKAVKADDAGTLSDVWGNNVVLAYVPQASLGMEEPSYGYTYTMTGHPLVEEPYYDNNAKSWVYGVGFERAPVLSGISSGFLIQTPA